MKLLIPDIIVPATGEKILRQYKCAKMTTDLNGNSSDITVAVTNRRIIQHSESGSKAGSSMIHHEMYIENVGGLSLIRQKIFNKRSFNKKSLMCFLIFLVLGGLCFWQSQAIFNVLSGSIPALKYDTVFKIEAALSPLVIFAVIDIILFVKSHYYVFNMLIISKGLTPGNIRIDGTNDVISKANYIIIPCIDEIQKMYSEMSSVILDIQRFGPDEIFNHIDPE